MKQEDIGQISLNISVFFYAIWLIPQLALTFRRKSTDGLSLGMHTVLVIGYLSDLTYGFGRHLPAQYRLVTILGLSCLVIEHFQFWKFGTRDKKGNGISFFLSNTLVLVFLCMIYWVSSYAAYQSVYNTFGMLALTCWLVFSWPQIRLNFLDRSTAGLSLGSVIFSLLTGLLDLVSSFTLHWDWPSQIGSVFTLFPKFIIIFQIFLYKNNLKQKNNTIYA